MTTSRTRLPGEYMPRRRKTVMTVEEAEERSSAKRKAIVETLVGPAGQSSAPQARVRDPQIDILEKAHLQPILDLADKGVAA